MSKYTINGFSGNYTVTSGKFLTLTGTFQDAERIKKALELYDELEEKFASKNPALLKTDVLNTVLDHVDLDRRLYNNRYTVSSSWIATVGYDTKTGTLRLYKKDGETITHTGVPSHLFYKVVNAESVGHAWNESVKGKYPLLEN